jgi:hypothetical protein
MKHFESRKFTIASVAILLLLAGIGVSIAFDVDKEITKSLITAFVSSFGLYMAGNVGEHIAHRKKNDGD